MQFSISKGGFQLLTEVVDQDRDPNPDDFVDRIITELLLSPDSGSTIQMESPGEFNFGFLRMSFDVVCNEDFGGPNCTAYCGVEGCSELVICDVVHGLVTDARSYIQCM